MRWTFDCIHGAGTTPETSSDPACEAVSPPQSTVSHAAGAGLGFMGASAPSARPWASDDPERLRRFLEMAQGQVGHINARASWSSAGHRTPLLLRVPTLADTGRHTGRPLWVAEPLLGHALARRPDGPGPLWRQCLGLQDDRMLRSERKVNAREVWPGLIMSAAPDDQPGLLRDWLATLAASRVGLVVDLRTDAERAVCQSGDLLQLRGIDAGGTRVRLNVESGAGAIPWNVAERSELHPRTLAMDLTDADGRHHRHAFDLIHLPLGAGETPPTAFLSWLASVAGRLRGATPVGQAERPPHQAPSVMVLSPQGLIRCAPLLAAIRLHQRLGEGAPRRVGIATQFALDLAVELRERRGPAMVWKAPALAALLSLAETWDTRGAEERWPSLDGPDKSRAVLVPRSRFGPPLPSQKRANQLLALRQARAEGLFKPRAPREPPPDRPADAAPPPPADPPSQKA